MSAHRVLPCLALALLPACGLLATHADEPRYRVRGPLPTRSQEPIRLTFLAFRPRGAEVLPEGQQALRVTSAYSSMFQNGTGPNERVVLDGELWRNSLGWRVGLGPSTELELELSVLYASSGFLDAFVEAWHSLLGLPGGGRDARPRNAYEMEVEKNGQLVYELEESEVGLTDIPIVLTHQIVTESESVPALALRAGVELPVGSESHGFGNGSVDWGAGVLAQKSWGRWTTTGAVDYVWAASSSAFEDAGVDAHDDLDLQLGLEYRWSDDVSLLTGLVLDSPVTRDFVIKELDRETASFDFGLAFDVGQDSTISVCFEEDLIADSGSDFAVYASWSFGL